MSQKIERDQQRFRKIVRGKVKSNLSKYISRGEMIGQKGKDLISIPLPQIDIPQFRFGNKGNSGAGQGEGDVGQPLTAPDGEGKGTAGEAVGPVRPSFVRCFGGNTPVRECGVGLRAGIARCVYRENRKPGGSGARGRWDDQQGVQPGSAR